MPLTGKDTPLVTVVIVSFNQKTFLEECLNSVASQTYNNIEIILVDDCSTDGSLELIDRLRQAFSFQYVQNQSNLGICKCFNIALKIAKGKYIVDLAGDDVFYQTRIATQVEELEQRYEMKKWLNDHDPNEVGAVVIIGL